MTPGAASSPKISDPANLRVQRRRWFILGAGLLGSSAMLGGLVGLISQRPVGPLGKELPRRSKLGKFVLTDRSGREVRRSAFEGKICIVSFAFTSCGLTCRQIGRNLARVETQHAQADDVRLITLSVDPRTDTPEVLDRFARDVGASTANWIFLTGDAQVLADLIRTSFPAESSFGGFGLGTASLAHLSRVYLVDATGRVRGSFDGMSPQLAGALERALAALRAETL